MIKEMEIVISRDDYGFIRVLIFKSRSHGHKIPRVESRDGRMTYGIRNTPCRSVALSYHDGRGGTQGVHAAHRAPGSSTPLAVASRQSWRTPSAVLLAAKRRMVRA